MWSLGQRQVQEDIQRLLTTEMRGIIKLVWHDARPDMMQYIICTWHAARRGQHQSPNLPFWNHLDALAFPPVVRVCHPNFPRTSKSLPSELPSSQLCATSLGSAPRTGSGILSYPLSLTLSQRHRDFTLKQHCSLRNCSPGSWHEAMSTGKDFSARVPPSILDEQWELKIATLSWYSLWNE